MYGIDISNIQKNIDLEAGKECFDFALLKASEGNTLKDKSVIRFADKLIQMDKLIGFYHFCRPDLHKKPDYEVNNFISVVVKTGLLHRAILVADWETDTDGNEEWLRNFCLQVKIKTGVTPFIYGSDYVLKKLHKELGNKFPFWVARWPNNDCYRVGMDPQLKRFDCDYEWKIWQYTNRGSFPSHLGMIDLDYSPLTREEWIKAGQSEDFQPTKENLSDEMNWAIENHLFQGYSDGSYRPEEKLTRNQLAVVLKRFHDQFIK